MEQVHGDGDEEHPFSGRGFGSYLSEPQMLCDFTSKYLKIIPDGISVYHDDGLDQNEWVRITMALGPHSLSIAGLLNVINHTDGREAAAAEAAGAATAMAASTSLSPQPPQEQSRLLLELTEAQPIPNFPLDVIYCTTNLGAQSLVTPSFLLLIEKIVLSEHDFAENEDSQKMFKTVFEDIHSQIIKAKVKEILEHFKCSGGNRRQLINDLKNPESSDLVYILKQCAVLPNVQFIKRRDSGEPNTLLSNLFGVFNVRDF